jgi:hypothetical protein
MEALVELHDNIMYYLLTILFIYKLYVKVYSKFTLKLLIFFLL